MALSPRENEVVRLVAEGKPNKIIAADLGLSLGTVKVYMSKIMRKLNVDSRVGVAMWFLRGGFLLLLLSGVLWSQTGGSVTETSLKTVTAAAGTGSTAVICVFTNPATPTVHTECRIGAALVLTQDSTPAVGATNGAVGSFVNAGNSVTWMVQQPSAGNVTWQIAANGTMKSGTF